MGNIDNFVLDTVNDVVEICRDRARDFESAAGAIDSEALRKELLRYSGERARYAEALSGALEEMGYAIRPHALASGIIRRGWINLIQMRPGNHDHAVLAACERGEDWAIEAYADAIGAHVPGRIAEMLSTQYQSIKATHDRIRELRDAADHRRHVLVSCSADIELNRALV
ncbi:MAG: PA2169 family four-helix-bundle protein [Tepidisphaeraceae bacterium]|jgi:uncharacterized protein (TIGR02284 family)